MAEQSLGPALASRIAVTVVYPLDPLGPKIGGSVAFIRGLLQHAPDDFDLRFIGITSDAAARPARRWRRELIEGRPFDFFPVLHERNEDRLRLIPLSLRFVGALLGGAIPDDRSVLVHNRLETVIARGSARHRNIVIVHNDISAQMQAGVSEVLWSRFRLAYFAFERQALKRVDQLFTVSAASLEHYREVYGDYRMRADFVPTWVDPVQFSPATQPRADVRRQLAALGVAADAGAAWILFIGRLQRQKAPERLIAAFKQVRQKRPDAQLLIVGDGNLRTDVELQVRSLGLDHCVHLLGAQQRPFVAMCYQAVDLLLLTSNFEGMPICVLEALSCGIPVVTTDVGEVRRVVVPGETGEISPNTTPEAISDLVLDVLEHRQRYSVAACLRAINAYSPQAVLAPVYESIRAQFRRGAP